MYKDHSLNKTRLIRASHTQASAPLSCEQSLQTLHRSTEFVLWSVRCTLHKILGHSLSLPLHDRETVQK